MPNANSVSTLERHHIGSILCFGVWEYGFAEREHGSSARVENLERLVRSRTMSRQEEPIDPRLWR
jgi:hypothetical protein